jgi:hypothetical protein
VCSGVLIGGLLDVLELEAVVEVVQSRAESQYRWGRQCRSWRRSRRVSEVCRRASEAQGGGGLASSAQHHQEDGPASSLGRLSMGTEQCAVVVFSKLKSIPRSMFFVDDFL